MAKWYDMRRSGEIRSANFQLHSPRNEDHNIIRNSLGSLEYPLFFHAERHGKNTTSYFSTRMHYGSGGVLQWNRASYVKAHLPLMQPFKRLVFTNTQSIVLLAVALVALNCLLSRRNFGNGHAQ